MPVYDLNNPEQRARAIAAGIIWSAPLGAQRAACEDIAAGRVPMPDYLPPKAKVMLAELGVEVPDGAPFTAEGSGPQ